MPTPFESQFFHDDGDDAYDGGPAMELGDEDDLWQGTQGQELKKTRPENVHFAKKAKRVDVKRLKDDIWTGLRSLVPETPADRLDSDDEVSLVGNLFQCAD
jgi:condensin complex subunit 2